MILIMCYPLYFKESDAVKFYCLVIQIQILASMKIKVIWLLRRKKLCLFPVPVTIKNRSWYIHTYRYWKSGRAKLWSQCSSQVIIAWFSKIQWRKRLLLEMKKLKWMYMFWKKRMLQLLSEWRHMKPSTRINESWVPSQLPRGR